VADNRAPFSWVRWCKRSLCRHPAEQRNFFKIVSQHIEERQLGFLGAPRVNVLVLNLELDNREKD